MSSATEQSGLAVSAPALVPVARKFKASELPLTSATRSAIEGLAHTFKKKGGYDAIRKEVWEKFAASVCSASPVITPLPFDIFARASYHVTNT
jgi:hypothetical protein